jgi:hypothetical protein
LEFTSGTKPTTGMLSTYSERAAMTKRCQAN